MSSHCILHVQVFAALLQRQLFSNPLRGHRQADNWCDNTAPKFASRVQVKSKDTWFPATGFCDTSDCCIEKTVIKIVLSALQLSLLLSKFMELFSLCGFFCYVFFSAILPNMISRRTGQIVLINSIQGKIGIPFRAACKLCIAKMYILALKLRVFRGMGSRRVEGLVCILIQ